MSKKYFLSGIFALIIGLSANSFCQNNFSFGIKGGVGFWKVSFEKGVDYSYPLGFTVGFFFENNISKKFSIVNELLFQNSITNIKIFSNFGVYLQQKLTTQYFNFPILLKYKTKWLSDTYFYLGPSFSYLIQAKYYNKITGIEENRDVTNKISRINVAIETGFGEKIKIYNSFLLLELRAQISLIKIHPENFDSLSVGDWNNVGIIFLIGYNL